MITVLLADDHANIRNILQLLLETAGDIQIAATASNGQEAVAQAVSYFPDVAVMDVSMPLMDGIEATKQIIARCPQTRVLMASMHHTPAYIQHCLRAGALGYVLKEVAGSELVKAVRSIYLGKRYFSKQIAEIARQFI